MIVIADTSPINYLVLIDAADLLSALFDTVFVPQGVIYELTNPASPSEVRDWAQNLPSWIAIRVVSHSDPELDWLGIGEREGISPAQEIRADLILLDDLRARTEAEKRRLKVTRTLGILRLAALRNLVDMPSALRKLQETSFYAPAPLIRSLLDEDDRRKRNT